jgi:amidohydrolase
MSNIQEQIKALSASCKKEIIAIRRDIHAHPELSFNEHRTSGLVEKFLSGLGLSPQRLATTGVVALLKGNGKSERTVALRADLDALPIQEANTVDYRSTVPGVMHACGHDVHTSCLLGAAKILCQMKGNIDGNIKFIFQPAEEKLPGGASMLIREGVLENPRVDAIIGQHVMPFIKTGSTGFRKGLYMASTDEIYITITGKGGHGAMPQHTVDPIATTAQIITALQQLVSRKAAPIIPTVLTFGKIYSDGGATNIIPSVVQLEGTVRTVDETWRERAKEHIRNITEKLAEAYGATADVKIVHGYPFLKNEEQFTDELRAVAEDYLGGPQVESLDMWLAAEDFAFYSHHVPACFYRLGTGNEAKNSTNAVHTDVFNIDEDAIETGMGLMSYLAVKAAAMKPN